VGKRQKEKPAAVVNYKKKKKKLIWKSLTKHWTSSMSEEKNKMVEGSSIFHLLDLATVDGHILHIPKIIQKNPLQCFYKIVTEGLISDMRREIQDVSYYTSRESY
jgi:hypothetical protein